MPADLRIIPRESALFSSSCKLSSLGVILGQVTAQASGPQVPWLVLCLWLQKGIWEAMAWPKAIDFYALSCSSFQKLACNLVKTAQRKSQD
jgi:hypothetical protein